MDRVPVWRRRRYSYKAPLIAFAIVLLVGVFWRMRTMDLDIGLQIVSMVLTVSLAAIGVEMANNPPRPDDDAKKWKYRVAFIAIGALLIGTTYWSGKRNADAQRQLKKDSDKTIDQVKQDFHADLQAQLKQQKIDLMDFLRIQARTPAEQAFVNRVTLAKMDFGFPDEATGGLKNVFATDFNFTIGGPHLVSKLLGFRLAGRVSGEVPVKNAHVWIRICPICVWQTTPVGFKRPDFGPTISTDIDKSFGDIPVGAIQPLGDFKIFIPANSHTVSIGIGYTCDNCAPADPKRQKTLTIRVPKSG